MFWGGVVALIALFILPVAVTPFGSLTQRDVASLDGSDGVTFVAGIFTAGVYIAIGARLSSSAITTRGRRWWSWVALILSGLDTLDGFVRLASYGDGNSISAPAIGWYVILGCTLTVFIAAAKSLVGASARSPFGIE